MVKRAYKQFAVSIRTACQVFSISESAYYYRPLLSGEIADWLLRTFNVIDDYNREALEIEVDLSLPSLRVIRSLEQIIEWRGKPAAIRCERVACP